MTRHIVGVVAGLATWFVLATAGGILMRECWPAYALVAETLTFAPEAGAPAFTLWMLIARLLMGALATVGLGLVVARITSSPVARLVPAVLLLIFFITEHILVWDKFPIWYHLTFLVSILPSAYVGNLIAGKPRHMQASLAG